MDLNDTSLQVGGPLVHFTLKKTSFRALECVSRRFRRRRVLGGWQPCRDGAVQEPSQPFQPFHCTGRSKSAILFDPLGWPMFDPLEYTRSEN